jgi:hypothetical protein
MAVVLRLYPHRDLGEIRVVFTDLEIDRDIAFTRLKKAFALLATTDIRRSRQVLKYLRTIGVWAGHYSVAIPPKTVQLSTAHVLDFTSLELASVFVHEAVHLRISRHGIPYDKELRERIERRCTAEQVSFLRRAGGEGEAIAESYEGALNRPWWTDKAHREDLERLATEHGLPRWVLSLMGGSISDTESR